MKDSNFFLKSSFVFFLLISSTAFGKNSCVELFSFSALPESPNRGTNLQRIDLNNGSIVRKTIDGRFEFRLDPLDGGVLYKMTLRDNKNPEIENPPFYLDPRSALDDASYRMSPDGKFILVPATQHSSKVLFLRNDGFYVRVSIGSDFFESLQFVGNDLVAYTSRSRAADGGFTVLDLSGNASFPLKEFALRLADIDLDQRKREQAFIEKVLFTPVRYRTPTWKQAYSAVVDVETKTILVVGLAGTGPTGLHNDIVDHTAYLVSYENILDSSTYKILKGIDLSQAELPQARLSPKHFMTFPDVAILNLNTFNPDSQKRFSFDDRINSIQLHLDPQSKLYTARVRSRVLNHFRRYGDDLYKIETKDIVIDIDTGVVREKK